jgi:hypothetical protein
MLEVAARPVRVDGRALALLVRADRDEPIRLKAFCRPSRTPGRMKVALGFGVGGGQAAAVADEFRLELS